MDYKITTVGEQNIRWFLDMIPTKKDEYVLWQDDYIILGAISDNTACGVLIAGIENGCAQIMWIYVAEDYRKNGIASALVKTMYEIVEKNDFRSCICSYDSTDYGYFLDRIFLNLGVEIETIKSYNYSFSIGELIERPRYIAGVNKYKLQVGQNYYVPLEKVPNFIVNKSRIYKEYQSYNYHPKLSSVAIKNKEIVGYLFIRENRLGNYYVEMLEIFEKNPAHTLGLMFASCKALDDMIKNGEINLDAQFSFQNTGEKGLGFAKRVFLVAPNETLWFHVANKSSKA